MEAALSLLIVIFGSYCDTAWSDCWVCIFCVWRRFPYVGIKQNKSHMGYLSNDFWEIRLAVPSLISPTLQTVQNTWDEWQEALGWAVPYIKTSSSKFLYQESKLQNFSTVSIKMPENNPGHFLNAWSKIIEQVIAPFVHL